MNIKDIQITPNVFFTIGKYCFLIIAFMGIFNFILLYKLQNFFTTISFIASTIFNLALAGFFHYMHKQQNPQMTEEYASDDVNAIIEEIKQNEEGKRKPRIQGKKKHS